MTIDVVPAKGTAAGTAGAFAALALLIGVPVGLLYLSKSKTRALTVL